MGRVRGDNRREYATWANMKQRCKNPKTIGWEHYGGRGISVCERWESFENFLLDMGPRPSAKHSLDRIDVNGNYEPSNCRWATTVEQGRNTRGTKWVEYEGRRITINELAELTGIPISTIRIRLHNGKPLDQIIKPTGRRPAVPGGREKKAATGKTRNINIRCDKAFWDAVYEIKAITGWSTSDVIRNAIIDRYNKVMAEQPNEQE